MYLTMKSYILFWMSLVFSDDINCNPAFLDRPTYIATLRESRTAIQRIPKKHTQVKVFLNEFSENLFLCRFFLHFALTKLLISDRMSYMNVFHSSNRDGHN